MALQQPGTGYRDPAKTMTIKALQERQKAAADAAARATAIPEGPMSSPFQGIAQLTGILSGQAQESRAAGQEADARARLAQVMAGIDPEKGASMAQIAEMQQLDPDFANREYERMMAERAAIRNREDEQSFKTGERVAGEGFTTSERVAGEGFTEKTAEELAREADRARRDAAGIAEGAAVTADTRADQNAIDQQALETAEKKRQEEAAVAETQRQEGLPQIEESKILDAYNKGQFGPVGSPEAVKIRDDALAKENESGLKPSDAYTPGQGEVDKKFAPDVIEWDMSGGSNATKAITQVTKAIDILQTKGGSGVLAGIADGVLPEWAAKYANRDLTIARDAVRETVQQTLRATLGAQFTEKEGAALMDRAFDINLLPEENIRRAKLLLQQVAGIAANKEAMVNHFKKNGTLVGYVGAPLDTASLTNMFPDDGTTPPSAGGGGGGGWTIEEVK